jgi:hypothetical protein
VASPLFAAREFAVSSDTSPPSRYRLENPARTAGAAGGAAATPQAAAATPSWSSVIGTTLRLWVRRRILHVPDAGRIGRARVAGFAAVIVVVVVAAAAAVVLALTGTPAPTAPRTHPVTKPKLTPAQQAARAQAAAQAAANGTAAATWVAAQAGQQVIIGCDPATCAAIVAAGYASGGQVVLQAGAGLPVVPGALVVATPAVRAQYGAELDGAAPEVIARFGTSAQAVQVRVVIAGGQAAYSQAATSAIAARAKTGRALIANREVHVHPIARKDLAAGLVDPRLLTLLRRLAAHYPVDINWFGDAGPLADSSVPFRLAEIINLSRKHAPHQASELAAVEKWLQHQPSGYRAALTVVPQPGGKYGLKIELPAPSPQ